MTHTKIQTEQKAEEKAEAKYKNEEEMADANSIETVKDGNRGASPEEMLRLIAKAEEKEFDKDPSRSDAEFRIQAEQEARSVLGDKAMLIEI